MKRWLLVLALLLLLPRPTWAAGSVTFTDTEIRIGTGVLAYHEYTFAWTSTAGGAVSGNAQTIAAGKIVSIRFSPGGTTPTDLYDVTVAETGGATDITGGQGANQSSTVPAIYSFDPPLVQDGTRTIDVVVAAAGASKTGTVVILVEVR